MMRRRELLQRLMKWVVTAGISPPALSSDFTASASSLTSYVPSGLYGEEALRAYFSEEALRQALGVTELKRPDDVEVIAFNFPAWHPSPYMESIFGKGWTEFDTLRKASSLFPGHTMPHYPLWGYYNEAAPEWAEREIDLAADHGLDAWMIDWYWHSGRQFYHEQLEQGFLKARNRVRLKFAVMWANHDWKNVYPARSPNDAATLLPQLHTLADCENVVNHCAERYFSQENYFRVSGAPLFGFFDLERLIEQLGEDGLKRALELFRDRSRKLGFPAVHLQVCNDTGPREPKLKEYGFDSATLYGTFAWSYGSRPSGSRIPYGVGASNAIAQWRQRQRSSPVPFFRTCSVGWDDSARYGEAASIAIDRSPDQFERLVRAARHESALDSHQKIIYIGAWNEWTEDNVLLPDTLWGYSYLEALRRAVRF